MPPELEKLRNKLEEKVLLKKPYKEIYRISIALDKEINKYYIRQTLTLRKEQ